VSVYDADWCGISHCYKASAHGKFFATAADYFLAVRTDGERNTTFSHFPHDLVQLVCALHKHETFVLSQHVLP
jgi:hypothetical protein